MNLDVLPQTFSVCRLEANAKVPEWLPLSGPANGLVALVRTESELSIVCESNLPPDSVDDREDGWRALRVEGPLDFEMIGVLSELCHSLAEAEVSVFAISTYDTDYLLVREFQLPKAIDALASRGHHFKTANRRG